MTSQGSSLAEFLRARYREDYDQERGNAPENSVQEVAARLRHNARLMNIGHARSMAGVPVEKIEAARYSDHPDYRQEWRP